MPTFRFVARFNGVSGLAEDVYENVLHYDVTTAGAIFETVADGIIAAFTAWGRHAGIDGAEVRVYALTGGQPLFRKSYAYSFTATSGPTEVALCLSYAAVDDWETSTSRRRGRIFLGPLSGSRTSIPRPTDTDWVPALDLAVALGAVGGSGATWMIYSRTDQTSAAIEVASVDDSWDTQRRRGAGPTQRITRDIAPTP